jgi:hypothetical protein
MFLTLLPIKLGTICDGRSKGIAMEFFVMVKKWFFKGDFQPIAVQDALHGSDYHTTTAAHKELIASTLDFYQRSPEAFSFLFFSWTFAALTDVGYPIWSFS